MIRPKISLQLFPPPSFQEDLLPLCREENLAVVPYQVLQGGLLTGKYLDPNAPPPDSRGAEKPDWLPMLKEGEVLKELRHLRSQAKESGLPLYDYALRTTLDTPGITSIILGVKRLEQLEQAMTAIA